jgi:hypothetical protein
MSDALRHFLPALWQYVSPSGFRISQYKGEYCVDLNFGNAIVFSCHLKALT